MTESSANISDRRIHPRHHARVAAVQVLFAIDMSDDSPDVVLSKVERMAEIKAEAHELLEGLVAGVRAHLTQIDEKIEHAAPMWPMGQMALVDKAIMRLAVYELLYLPEIPPKVVINEAVELAKIYASDNSPRFVNGVLATIYEQIVAKCTEDNASV